MGPVAPTYATVSQVVSGFVIGQSYTLSLYLANSGNTACSFVVNMDNMLLFSTTDTAYDAWTLLRWTFNATNFSHTLVMAGYNTP